jgi:glycosyltransferase involved in cell wall biosynthesis
MAAGLPVVAMSVGGNPMLVEDGVNGYLLNVGDHTTLAEVIDQLATNFELRQQLGKGSLARVIHFSWQTCTARYAELLGSLDAMSRGK